MDNYLSNQENEKQEFTISGRLGADAKLGESKNEQKPVLTFSIADNSDKENVQWHNVQMWEDKIPNQKLNKGDAVELKGYFRTYETANGQREEFVATQVSSHTPKQENTAKVTHTIKGNLGQDPEFKKVNDKNVAAFSIAINDDKDKPVWQNVQVWNENIEKNKIDQLKKGDFVELKGHYGKEYTNKNDEVKKDFILEESKVLKFSEKKDEKQGEKLAEKPAEKLDEKKSEKKSRGIKM